MISGMSVFRISAFVGNIGEFVKREYSRRLADSDGVNIVLRRYADFMYWCRRGICG